MIDLGGLVDRILLVGFEEPNPPDWVRRAAPHLGAVVLFGQNLRSDASAARLAATLRSQPEAPEPGRNRGPGADSGSSGDVLIAVDEEGGDVTRLHYHGGSPTPGNYVLGAADDVVATEAVAGRIGAGLRAAGIMLDLAPDVDVNVDPENPVIGVRSFGAEPDLVSRHAAAWVRGLQAIGVAGCAKHFPGHGDTRVDSHLALPTVPCTEREWRRVHLPPFLAAIEAGVCSIMTAHLLMPALDSVPATLSRRILHDLLRSELAFDGVVVTDALEMAAIVNTMGVPAAAVAALAAGADALCLGAAGGERRYREVRSAIVDAVRAGELPMRRVEEAAARVARLHAWIATAPAGSEATAATPAPADDPGLALARRAAVTSRVPPLAARPVVIELRASPNLAVAAAAWDLASPLRDLGLPPLHTVLITGPGAALDAVLARAAGHPVVVVGRDVVRTSWQRALWERALAVRPDAVLVDLGLPRPHDLGRGAWVLVGGAGRPSLRAAAELLVTGSDAASERTR